MSQTEPSPALIDEIYDAALDPALWPATLSRLAGFVGGCAASLYAKDVAGSTCQIYFDDGALDRGWIDRYTDRFVKMDPSTVRQYFGQIGQGMSTADLMPYREFLDTRFAAEWARPQHLVDALSAVLEKSGAQVMLVTVFRDTEDGLVDLAARRRMTLIAPHIRRAAHVAAAMSEAGAKAAALTDMFDAVAVGVLLLDRSRAVVEANAAARRLLDGGRLFQPGAIRLTPLDAAADRQLAAALAAPIGAAPARTAPLTLVIADSAGERYVAQLLPLGARGFAAGLPRRAVAALFIRPASFPGAAAPEVLARAYHLTPTELRILLALAEIGGVPEVAEALGVAGSTVKSHLRQLFDKTGTRRQAELVRLLAAFSPPLGG
jgi:DNA-binding CsgD family transcriptional regulator